MPCSGEVPYSIETLACGVRGMAVVVVGWVVLVVVDCVVVAVVDGVEDEVGCVVDDWLDTDELEPKITITGVILSLT